MSGRTGGGDLTSVLLSGWWSTRRRAFAGGDSLKAYKQSPLLFRNFNKIAEVIGRVKWRVVIDGEYVDPHPWSNLLQQGEPEYGLSGPQLLAAAQVHYDAAGEFFLIRRVVQGRLVAVSLVPPRNVLRVPEPGFSSFLIRTKSGDQLQLEASEVLWVKRVDPEDPIGRGLGIAKVAMDELETDEAAARHSRTAFNNGGTSPAIISGKVIVDKDEGPITTIETKEDAERLQAALRNRSQDPKNVGHPVVTNVPLEVHQLAQSLKDLEFTTLRDFEGRMVDRLAGVPAEIFGDLTSSNRATSHNARMIFHEFVISPRIETMAAAFKRFMGPFYPGAVLEPEDIAPNDKEFKLLVMQAKPGAFMVDDWRELAEAESLGEDGGGHFYTSGIQDMATTGPAGSGSIAGALNVEEEAADADLIDVEPRRRLPGRTKAINDDDIDELTEVIDDDASLKTMAGTLVAIIRDTFGFEALILGVNFSTQLVDTVAQRYVRTIGSGRITRINDTLRGRIRDALNLALDEGDSFQGIVKRLDRVFAGKAANARLRAIAQTETHDAAQFSIDEAMREAGVKVREWATLIDGRQRDEHESLNGTRKNEGEPFKVGGYSALRPGGFGEPEMDINCRCTLLPIFDETKGLGPIQRTAILKFMDGHRRENERRYRVRYQQLLATQREAIISAVAARF